MIVWSFANVDKVTLIKNSRIIAKKKQQQQIIHPVQVSVLNELFKILREEIKIESIY